MINLTYIWHLWNICSYHFYESRVLVFSLKKKNRANYMIDKLINMIKTVREYAPWNSTVFPGNYLRLCSGTNRYISINVTTWWISLPQHTKIILEKNIGKKKVSDEKGHGFLISEEKFPISSLEDCYLSIYLEDHLKTCLVSRRCT